MIKENKYIIIFIILIIIGIFLIGCKLIYNHEKEQEDKNKIQEFFETEIINKDTTVLEEKKENLETTIVENQNKEMYIAVLEIPSISLKKGIYDINSKNNDVNKNIQLIKESDMPDIEDGNFILAGHSGIGRIAYFKKLEQLNLDDIVFVYYKGIKYSYQIISIYLENKDGTISISNENQFSKIILTTCSQKEKDKQVVVVGRLISKEKY